MKNEEQQPSVLTEQSERESIPSKITKEDFYLRAKTRKGKTLHILQTILYLLVSSFLVAFAAYSLISPNEFTVGGVTGIAILLAQFGLPQSIMVPVINLPLVVLSFFFVRKKFAVLSAANILLQTVWFSLFETLFPDFVIKFSEGGERIFAAIAGGLCIGTAVALAFKIGGSTGGADILAVMIQKKIAATSIARMIFLVNSVIILSSVFVFHEPTEGGIDYGKLLLPIMMSVFEVYIESKTNESITNGFHSAIEFRIITDKPEEMANALMKGLSRGATSLPAKGMYTKAEHSMLLCVVSRRQAATLKRIMKEVDPDSFAVMANVSQVLGLGFYSAEL